VAGSEVEARTLQWPFDVGPPSAYGPRGDSLDGALSLIPVYAAARLLADSVASLPLQTYRNVGDHAVKLGTPSLFRNPSATGTLYDWLFACMSSLVLKGNAYGLVTQRDGMQFPTLIEWLNPECVWVDESTRAGRFYLEGRELAHEDVLHLRAFTVPGRLQGISPIGAFAATIGAGLSQVQYGADWFAAGGFPPGTFKNSAMTVEEEDADRVKVRLSNAIRSRQPLVYGSDWDYTPISVPPSEAQFIAASQMTATQIAAVYGIPAERIGGGTVGGSLTYKNQEQDEIAFQAGTIRPWVTRLEQGFFGLLPERQYVRFNLNATVRSDLKTRFEVYRIQREIGFANIDEQRALEELQPLPAGEGQDYEPLAAMIAEDPAEDLTEPPEPGDGGAPALPAA
jgi:HK97 family phage portal protein